MDFRGHIRIKVNSRWMGYIGMFLLTAILFGCAPAGNLRQFIRARDYRSVNQAQQPRPAASPLPNVFDMPGWTEDAGMASDFARENSRRSVVFVRRSGQQASARSRDALLSAEANDAMGDAMRIVIDLDRNPADAARYGVHEAPALVILDPAGNPVARRVGSVSKSTVVSALR